MKRSKGLISMLLWGEGDDDFGKAKNIRQTELLVDLREAILQVARHFQSIDPKNSKIVSPHSFLALPFSFEKYKVFYFFIMPLLHFFHFCMWFLF